MSNIRLILGLVACLAAGFVVAQDSSEQQIRAALDNYHLAEREGDLDGILDAYAEDFVDPLGATKSMLVDFFT